MVRDVSRISLEALERTVEAINDQLRPEAQDYMGAVTRAAIHDAYEVIPLARRVINDYDVDLPAEVFILSLQAHFNLYFDSVLAILKDHARADVEADTLAWLCVHYILLHGNHLNKVSRTE